MSDPYLDLQYAILRNKFELNDQASLDRAEADAVALRSILLQSNPLKEDFDSQHLKQIHEYPWNAESAAGLITRPLWHNRQPSRAHD
jgi:fido (protein-threonine AMPylation protein)